MVPALMSSLTQDFVDKVTQNVGMAHLRSAGRSLRRIDGQATFIPNKKRELPSLAHNLKILA
jgi:hypothetical protein